MLTNGVLTGESPVTGTLAPFGIVLAADGNFYIGDEAGSQVARFVPSTSTVTLYPTKSANAKPYLVYARTRQRGLLHRTGLEQHRAVPVFLTLGRSAGKRV